MALVVAGTDRDSSRTDFGGAFLFPISKEPIFGDRV